MLKILIIGLLSYSSTVYSSSTFPNEETNQQLTRLRTSLNQTQAQKCNPRHYVQKGYCHIYFSCNRKTRTLLKRECSRGLYWNPKYNSIHGGVCDYLKNIQNDTLTDYQKDVTCILRIAYFRAGEECSSRYFYNHPVRTSGVEKEEFCPPGLVWSQEKESCELCHLVNKSEGVPCCTKEEEDDY